MKHKLRKGLAVGIICLLMLVSIPMVSGEDILYPKEEGPYNVLIIGKCSGMGGGLFTVFRLVPLWFLFYPRSIMWHFQPDSVFFVNGEKQDIVYPAFIWLGGFKGYGTTIHMILLKHSGAILATILIGPLTGFIPRARVVGRCTDILVSDAR
ncbi:MAG: hypothetical protein JSW60_03850 [Thermoplasmatales archaeon]|nr:MAG: hypothetical protein JSW60_03850 [Thermoplasmatales archaeon]